MKKITILTIALILLTFLFKGCTEPYEIKSIDFESVLVVESTLTNELKTQEVKLSRTSTLENTNILTEQNATVIVVTNDGRQYGFSQDTEIGSYWSDEQFKVDEDVEYTLTITTNDGKKYTSKKVTLPQEVEIDKVYAEFYEEEGKKGAQVYVDSKDPTGKAKYFRYEYEETYEIVTLYSITLDAEIVNYNEETGEYDIILTEKEPEDVCYSSQYSTGIIQTATTDLAENEVFHFPVRFLDEDNSLIRDQYSILVKQYVQSIEAYTFYETITELGSVESLLSQGQPGYVTGNMTSVGNPEEKVLGFFEASPVTTKRTFFNYEDVGLEKPPYFYDFCQVYKLDYRDNTVLDEDGEKDRNERKFLREKLLFNNYQIVEEVFPIYYIVQGECSYCTLFSSNVKPDYWED